ncbi:unnamed protein product [Aureobasidium pullulans]|nr:unnamed protein product [Aureobasidium pullulans]
MLALKCMLESTLPLRHATNASHREKNAKSKEMIRAKAAEYMERAEKLKNHLAEQDTNRKKPSAVGANGKTANGGAKGKYVFHTVYMLTGMR